MATYSQWRTAFERGEVKRATWVCGEETVLVEEVIDTLRAHLRPDFYRCLSAGTDTDRTVWDTLYQYPNTPGQVRLVVLRDAHRLGDWTPLDAWLGAYRALSGSYLLAVSHEPDTHRPGGEVPEHIRLFATRGRVVRCAAPNDTDLLAWAQRRHRLPEASARRLLNRCAGDLHATAAVLAKLALLGVTDAPPALIDRLAEPAPQHTFTDALIHGRKPDALAAGDELSDREAITALALVDSRLDTLAALHRPARANTPPRDIHGVPPFLVRAYLPVAGHYPPRRCLNIRRVVAVCDGALRRGVRTGVLETLVALW